MPHAHIDLLLAPDTEAPSTARRSLSGLEQSLSTEQLEYARLLVTELVTNSVLHASLGSQDEIRLRVAVSAGMLCVEVTDLGEGFERPAWGGVASEPGLSQTGTKDERGRGLYLVDRISDRWGVCLNGATRVWFEIDHL